MDTDEALRRAGDSFRRRLAGLTEPDWSRPTPCGDWNVRQVANHVVGGALMYSLLLEGADGADLAARRDDDHLGPDPTSSLSANLSALAAAIHRPGALDGTVRHPRGELPAAWIPLMAAEELLVHGWDIARAADGDAAIDDELAAWVLPLLEEIVPRFRAAGIFRPPATEPVAGTTPGERLLHLTGR